MQKITKIDPLDISEGFFIELECINCSNSTTIASSSKEDLIDKLCDEGWRTYDDSDIIGHYCGCKIN